jgi:hypothetical protein
MIKTFTLDNDKLDTGEITFSEEYNHLKFDKNINHFKIEVIPFIINFSTELTTVVKFEV